MTSRTFTFFVGDLAFCLKYFTPVFVLLGLVCVIVREHKTGVVKRKISPHTFCMMALLVLGDWHMFRASNTSEFGDSVWDMRREYNGTQPQISPYPVIDSLVLLFFLAFTVGVCCLAVQTFSRKRQPARVFPWLCLVPFLNLALMSLYSIPFPLRWLESVFYFFGSGDLLMVVLFYELSREEDKKRVFFRVLYGLAIGILALSTLRDIIDLASSSDKASYFEFIMRYSGVPLLLSVWQLTGHILRRKQAAVERVVTE